MKRAILIGANSNLAKSISRALRDEYDIVTAGRSNSEIIIDLSHRSEISLPESDVVIHAAASFDADDIFQTEYINAMGALSICIAAKQSNTKHMVFLSSTSVNIEESSPYFGIYALSKRHGEELVKLYCSKYGMPYTALRLTQMYGNEDTYKIHQPLLYNIVNQAQKNHEVTLFGSHDALRNYMHIDDLNEIILRVLKMRVQGSFNVCYPADVRLTEIAKAAIAAFQSKSTIRFLPEKADMADNVFSKDDELYSMIGYVPSVSIVEGMQKIAKYRKDHAYV